MPIANIHLEYESLNGRQVGNTLVIYMNPGIDPGIINTYFDKVNSKLERFKIRIEHDGESDLIYPQHLHSLSSPRVPYGSMHAFRIDIDNLVKQLTHHATNATVTYGELFSQKHTLDTPSSQPIEKNFRVTLTL